MDVGSFSPETSPIGVQGMLVFLLLMR